MAKRTQKSIRNSCDLLWSQIVKARAGHRCERCGKQGRLEAHHAYGRANYRLRFEPRNGTSLCFQCHLWAEGFSILFAEWFKAHRSDDAEFLAAEYRKGILRRTIADYRDLEADLALKLEALTGDWEDAA